MLNDTEFKNRLFDALAACFGLSPSSAAASALIHPAYTEPENAPRPPRDRDVIYFDLQSEDDPGDRNQVQLSSPSGETLTRRFSVRLAYRLVVICYGPLAELNARKIRAFLYLDGRGNPLQILRSAGLYPIPHPPPPLIGHEQEGSLWRKRCDVTISLRAVDELEKPNIGSVRVAPVPVIHPNQ